MWCPECRAEYREGYQTCADCGVKLMPGSPPAEKAPEDEQLVELAHFETTAEAGMVKELLEKNGITCVFHGGTDPIGAPISTGQIELLVDEDDFARAEELYQAFFEAQRDAAGQGDAEPADEEA
jgi:hypothetical protein